MGISMFLYIIFRNKMIYQKANHANCEFLVTSDSERKSTGSLFLSNDSGFQSQRTSYREGSLV